VDYLLQNNNPDFLDTANMESLSILSGLYANIDPEIFQTLFQGWQTNHCVKIAYADWQGEVTERIIEPHTLVFFNNSWYTKAFCCLKNQPRTFALRRIKKAELLKSDFEPNKEIISSVNPDDFLGFEKIKNVKLLAASFALDRLKSSPLHTHQFDDYSKYECTLFDAAHKDKMRKTQFISDLSKAFEMGRKLAE